MFRDLGILFRAGLPHTQLGRGGILETVSTSALWRNQHNVTEPAACRDKAQARGGFGTTADLDAGADADASCGGDTSETALPPPLRFVSTEQRTRRELPERRIPICFPNLTLQMMKLSDQQLKQLKETGWLREVAFRTTPDVTKLEIEAFLESVYGMSVERVHTINYLGKRRMVLTRRGKRLLFREDDWKKAYVIFRPPPGLEYLLSEGGAGQDPRPVIEQVREAARAPRRARPPPPWEQPPSKLL